MAGGRWRLRIGGRSGVGLGTAATLFETGPSPSSSSPDSSPPTVGLGCHKLVSDLWGEITGAYLDVGAMSSVFLDEDAPGVSSSLVEMAISSLSGFISKAGGVPAGL